MGIISNQLDLINCQEEDTTSLYQIFKSINESSIPVIRVYLPQGTTFIRQRINTHHKIFTNISELSYPPRELTRNYGRANIPYSPMFYCCTFRINKNSSMPIPRVVALLETSDFAKDKERSGIEIATCSKWRSNKELSLIALPFSDNYLRPCDDIKYIQNEWNKC